MMLVKNLLDGNLAQGNTFTEDRIVVSSWPNLKIGRVYISPADSPCYHPRQYSVLVRHAHEFENVVLTENLNARVAVPKLSNDCVGTMNIEMLRTMW